MADTKADVPGEPQVPNKVTYAEMRLVAQEIHRLEKQARRIRFAALICIGLLVGTAVFAGVIALLVSAFKETDVKKDGPQLALVKKNTDKVIATTQSLEDLDACDLIRYLPETKDAQGYPDGNWVLPDDRIGLVRAVSWRANNKTEVHHVAEIQRHDGIDARVEMVTKAGHKITVWDDTDADNFNVEIERYDRVNKKLGPKEEVNAEGDEDGGCGRMLVSLTRPQLLPRPRPINVDAFWD
jgi:hypothetical protein